jgi:hypothetical protein
LVPAEFIASTRTGNKLKALARVEWNSAGLKNRFFLHGRNYSGYSDAFGSASFRRMNLKILVYSHVAMKYLETQNQYFFLGSRTSCVICAISVTLSGS